tara:strand:+ start:57 stop:476 length:420 start_codon:yes stop_codon:yes gene_type:complete
MKIYNAQNLIVGRLAAKVAKEALLGEEVFIVNCNQAVISGDKNDIMKREKQRRSRSGYPLTKAKLPRSPDRFVRRAVRGMLPWKFTRGKEAFKRVMCYRNLPEELNGKELLTIKEAQANKLPGRQFLTVERICTQLGGK